MPQRRHGIVGPGTADYLSGYRYQTVWVNQEHFYVVHALTVGSTLQSLSEGHSRWRQNMIDPRGVPCPEWPFMTYDLCSGSRSWRGLPVYAGAGDSLLCRAHRRVRVLAPV